MKPFYLVKGPNTDYDGRFVRWAGEGVPPEPYFKSDVQPAEPNEVYIGKATDGSPMAEMKDFPPGFLKIVLVPIGFPPGSWWDNPSLYRSVETCEPIDARDYVEEPSNA